MEIFNFSEYTLPQELEFKIKDRWILAKHTDLPDYPTELRRILEHKMNTSVDQFEDEDGDLDVNLMEQAILNGVKFHYGEAAWVEYGNDGYVEDCLYLLPMDVVREIQEWARE